jgi:hypothetical protein
LAKAGLWCATVINSSEHHQTDLQCKEHENWVVLLVCGLENEKDSFPSTQFWRLMKF